MQAINFIGCLKSLKFRLFGIHWTQPRKREEKVNLKESRRTPVKKIDLEFEGGKIVRYEFEKLQTPVSGEMRE